LSMKEDRQALGLRLFDMRDNLTEREITILSGFLEKGVMTRDDARVFAKLSRVSKMPEFSFSLPRLITCPGSQDSEVCAKCYASRGRYLWDNVKLTTLDRLEDTKKDTWVLKMAIALFPRKWHRWHDMGDIYDLTYMGKIAEVCALTPQTRHWIPTKVWRLPWARKGLKALGGLDNVTVRWSGTQFVRGRVKEFGEFGEDVIGGVVLKGRRPSLMDTRMAAQGEYLICPAHEQEGRCGQCRACWYPEHRMVAYLYH